MKRKTGLGADPLTWIQDTSIDKGAQPPKTKKEPRQVRKLPTSEVPKFRSFKVKLSILMRSDQLEFLEKTTKEIMTSRSKGHKKERITKNTILRAVIDGFKNLKIDKTNIANEAELLNHIKAAIVNTTTQ